MPSGHEPFRNPNATQQRRPFGNQADAGGEIDWSCIDPWIIEAEDDGMPPVARLKMRTTTTTTTTTTTRSKSSKASELGEGMRAPR